MLRWLSIPFHLLFGVFFHMYGLFELWRVRFTEDGDACALKNVPEADITSAAPEDARFIEENWTTQVILAILITFLATAGCV